MVAHLLPAAVAQLVLLHTDWYTAGAAAQGVLELAAAKADTQPLAATAVAAAVDKVPPGRSAASAHIR
jgi:hypothetical protein